MVRDKMEVNMRNNGISIECNRIEQKLSQIGAKIANATDLSRQAKELANRLESTLINAQKEIDFLYGSLEDNDSLEASEESADL